MVVFCIEIATLVLLADALHGSALAACSGKIGLVTEFTALPCSKLV